MVLWDCVSIVTWRNKKSLWTQGEPHNWNFRSAGLEGFDAAAIPKCLGEFLEELSARLEVRAG